MNLCNEVFIPSLYVYAVIGYHLANHEKIDACVCQRDQQADQIMANKLIAHYQMEAPLESDRIEPDVNVLGYIWKDLPTSTQQWVKALIEHKLSLDYDPTMVDPEWRDQCKIDQMF